MQQFVTIIMLCMLGPGHDYSTQAKSMVWSDPNAKLEQAADGRAK